MDVTPKSGETSPKGREENNPQHVTENRGEIPPKEPDEVTDLMTMEEGVRAQTPDKKTYSKEGEWTTRGRKFAERITTDGYSTALCR